MSALKGALIGLAVWVLRPAAELWFQEKEILVPLAYYRENFAQVNNYLILGAVLGFCVHVLGSFYTRLGQRWRRAAFRRGMRGDSRGAWQGGRQSATTRLVEMFGAFVGAAGGLKPEGLAMLGLVFHHVFGVEGDVHHLLAVFHQSVGRGAEAEGLMRSFFETLRSFASRQALLHLIGILQAIAYLTQNVDAAMRLIDRVASPYGFRVRKRVREQEEGARFSPEFSGRDPYAVLGVPRGADETTVKAAYRRLVKEHHPDALKNLSEREQRKKTERFLEIQAAYEEIRAQRGF